jgi:protein phosphatase
MTSEATDEPEVNVPDPGQVGSSATDASDERTGEPESSGGIVVASQSDVGQVRSANEDTCDTFERPDGTRLLVVADGMGGHQGGATASRTAVATIAEVFSTRAEQDPSEMLRVAIQAANHRVFELAQADSSLEGMGTTVVTFLLDAHGNGTVAHVGDSRAYRYRRGQLEPLTVDHSVVAEMHRRGLISADEAAVHPRRNEILRSVGGGEEVEVEVATVEVAPGDRFVLCSDGLTGVLSDEEIAAVVQAESPHDAVLQLIQLTNDRGAPDNISVQVLSIPASGSDGDPEATAPIELSEVGIQAIEAKRRERKRSRSATIVVIGLSVCIALYLAWQAFAPAPERPGPGPSLEDAPSPMPNRSGSVVIVDSIAPENPERKSDLNGPIDGAQARHQPDDSNTREATGDEPADTAHTADVHEAEGRSTPVVQDAEDSFVEDANQPPRRGIPQKRF